MYPTIRFCVIVELLDVQSGQLLQLDVTDAGFDMVADVVGVVLHGAGADVRLGVGFEPQPHPFGHRVVSVEVDGRPTVFLDCLSQSVTHLGLAFAEDAFHDPLAGSVVCADGVPTFPSTV